MPNITSAGVFWEEGKEPPDYEDPRAGDAVPEPASGTETEPEAAEPGEAAAEVKAPPLRAPRAEWAAHAVSQGADPGEVDEMTKQQLVDTYGNGAPAGE